MNLLVAIGLTLCAASNAYADAAGSTVPVPTEQAYFEELPVVLSVSRLAQSLDEAPGAVTVIDRDMIRQSGARQIVDLLRFVPGFQVANVPASKGAPVAVYHGLGEAFPRHMQVLVDGRSQYSPSFVGGVNWGLIPVSLNDIDHIEVVRGSNSAAYGANAVLGVVNIVTRHSQETQGASAELHSGTGGINDKRLTLGAGGQDFSWRYTSESHFDNGFDNFRDNSLQRFNSVRADWRPGVRDELRMQLGEIATSQQVGDGTVLDPWREQRVAQQYLQLGWRRTVSESEEISVNYYRSEERAVNGFFFSGMLPLLLPAPHYEFFTVPVDYGFRSRRDDIEVTHTLSPWRNTRLAWGGEVRSDAVRGPMYYGTTDEVTERMTRLFGNLEWRMTPAWIANVGANWEHDTNTASTFAPRLALNWHAAPGQTLRAGMSRAYRTPSLYETAGNYSFTTSTGLILDRRFMGSPNLRPESITTRELGWVGDFKALRLTGDVRVFEERLTDRVIKMMSALSPPYCDVNATYGCASAEVAYNAQNVRIRGVEYQWRWQPFDTTRLIFNQSFVHLSAQMVLPGASIAPDYQPATDAIQAGSSAPTRATSLMLMQQLPGGLQLSAMYQSSGAMMWGGNTDARAWKRLDWRMAYPFRMGPTRGELAFTVQSDGAAHIEHADNRGKPWLDELVTKRGYFTLRLAY